jgi:hypothetical protein
LVISNSLFAAAIGVDLLSRRIEALKAPIVTNANHRKLRRFMVVG